MPVPAFTWDETKRQINLAKHGLDFADVVRMDWDNATILKDSRFDYREERYWAFAMLDGRLHMVAFTRRGSVVRIISFRVANKKEVRRHGP